MSQLDNIIKTVFDASEAIQKLADSISSITSAFAKIESAAAPLAKLQGPIAQVSTGMTTAAQALGTATSQAGAVAASIGKAASQANDATQAVAKTASVNKILEAAFDNVIKTALDSDLAKATSEAITASSLTAKVAIEADSLKQAMNDIKADIQAQIISPVSTKLASVSSKIAELKADLSGAIESKLKIPKIQQDFFIDVFSSAVRNFTSAGGKIGLLFFRSMASVASAGGKIGLSFFRSIASSVQAGFGYLTQTAKAAGSKLFSLTMSVLSLGAGALASVGAKGLDLVKSGAQYAFEMAKFRESTLFAWKHSLGSAENAATTFGYAQKIANTLGESSTDVAKQLQEAFSEGVGADQAERMVQVVSDLRKAGNTSASMGQLTSVLKAMQGGQGLSEELLAPLTAINRDAVLDSLAQSLGNTEKDAEKRRAQVLDSLGELKGQQGIDAFQDAFKQVTGHDKAGALTKEFNDTTITGSIDKIKNSIGDLFTSMETSAPGKVLVDALQKIAGVLNPSSESGQKLVATLDKAAGAAGRIFAMINMDKAISAFSMIAEAVDMLIGPLESIGTAFMTGLGDSLEVVFELVDFFKAGDGAGQGFMTVMRGIASAVGFVLGGVVLLIGGLGYLVVRLIDFIVEMAPVGISMGRTIMNGLIDGISSAIGWIIEKFHFITSLPSTMMAAGQSIGTSIIDGIGSGIDSAKAWLIEKITALGELLPDTVRQLLGINSPSRVFAEIGAGVPLGFAMGVEREADAAQDATLSTLSPRLLTAGAGFGGAKAGVGAISLTNHIEINGSADSDEVRRAAEEGATAGAMRVFELLGLETGTTATVGAT